MSGMERLAERVVGARLVTAIARLASVAALVVVIAASLTGCAAFGNLSDLKAMEIVTPSDLGAIADGTYHGEWDAGLVRAAVNVTMDSGRIELVDIVEHECLRGGPAEVIVEDVVEQQSLEVDAVSGATASSKAILKSIEVALSSAPRR